MWWKVILIYLVLVNFAAFTAFGIDKRKARKGKFRISEKNLLIFGAVGGAAGSLLGMKTFHHKTRKTKFRVLEPVFLGVWIILVGLFICCVLK